jgi:hypothetical protein
MTAIALAPLNSSFSCANVLCTKRRFQEIIILVPLLSPASTFLPLLLLPLLLLLPTGPAQGQ